MVNQVRGGSKRWEPTSRQSAFLARQEWEALYGGAKGGGKTDTLLMWSILRRMKYPRSRGLFIRRQISEITRQGAAWDRIQELLGNTVRYVRTPRPTVYFPNGSVLEFNHCANTVDMAHYQGAQYDDICFDQLEQFTEQMYRYISAACRTSATEPPRDTLHNPIQPRVRSSANPGDVGHAWVKKTFVDSSLPGKARQYMVTIPLPDGSFQQIARARVFVPALLFDNPHLNAEYAATLNDLPEPYRSAYLFGRWDVFIGQAFPDFHPLDEAGLPYHVVPTDTIPKRWLKAGGHDYGYSGMNYTCWGALDPDGGIVIYREQAVKRWTADQVAKGVMMLQGAERVTTYWSGGDTWASRRANLTLPMLEALEDKGVLHLSPFDQYSAAGWSNLTLCLNWRDRIAGKLRLHGLLDERPKAGPDGRAMPWLRIMDCCPKLIETMQLIQMSKTRTEDVETDYAEDDPVRDDPYDGLRYLLMSLNADLMEQTPMEEAIADWRMR